MVIFSKIGLLGGDLQEVAFSFLGWGLRFFFLGLDAISEVNLPAWNSGTCFRNKILLHHGALCKTVLFKSPGKKGTVPS